MGEQNSPGQPHLNYLNTAFPELDSGEGSESAEIGIEDALKNVNVLLSAFFAPFPESSSGQAAVKKSLFGKAKESSKVKCGSLQNSPPDYSENQIKTSAINQP